MLILADTIPWCYIMEITEVRVSPREDGKLRGFASVTLDSCFVIRGLKIIEGQDRLFVAMPSRKRDNGSYQDIAHPITQPFRESLENAVLDAYNTHRETPPS